MEKDLLSVRIGQRLRHCRQQRQLSLDKLADLTGVSKPMLGQIERGVSNPTVATLWKIASGLNIPFTSLIAENASVQLRRRDQQLRVVEDDERFEVYNTYSAPGVPLEMYRVRLHPGCWRDAEPHGVQVIESVTVHQGILTMDLGNETYELQTGDALSFSADVRHIYRNMGNSLCEIGLAILYQSGARGV